MIRSVVLDIGETLLSDAREWRAWADWIGVPQYEFCITLGAVTGAGRHITEAFEYFRPGFDLTMEQRRREEAGRGERYDDGDLYPDVRPALSALRDMGLWVGVVGNQTAVAGRILRSLGLPVDYLSTSGEWGVGKPDPAFFDRVGREAEGEPEQIVYVGDHPDKDVLPAKRAGLRAAHIRRGPWGRLWADAPRVIEHADWRIDRLTELPELLRASGPR
ncbi:HAD family hydrolase [Embleya hyalina]|uniref:Haloacid dehalogenase n=1 Tax=Embleya hyalina TaxID=516124 RepID=A0A401YED4_9ACTN|nr:HAD family hydrolase [Embleya hyalina]GCD92947.1 haloacid dehalogenase [Embleya hyalina]